MLLRPPLYLALLILAGVATVMPVAAGQSSGVADLVAEAKTTTTRILNMAGDIAYGEYLGAECATCHRQSDEASGIPSVMGLPADYTVQSLVEYKLGIRDNNVMKLMTARLTDEDIAALAAYFSTTIRE